VDYDLIVIGGGPAGYAGAIRAGQLGKRVACIEQERAGGTCLNWGCIPTKALLKSAELYRTLRKADAFGLSVGEVGFDFAKVMERSRGVAGQMAKGIEFLFRKNKVDYLVGRAQVAAPGMVELTEGEHKGRFLRPADPPRHWLQAPPPARRARRRRTRDDLPRSSRATRSSARLARDHRSRGNRG
jgi:dihydrolipoamide dehydrogenase